MLKMLLAPEKTLIFYAKLNVWFYYTIELLKVNFITDLCTVQVVQDIALGIQRE